MVELSEVDGMKVADLKTACKELGLDVGGNKADLVARLKAALQAQPAAAGEADAAEAGGAALEGTAAVADTGVAEATSDAPAVEGKRPRIAFSETEAAVSHYHHGDANAAACLYAAAASVCALLLQAALGWVLDYVSRSRLHARCVVFFLGCSEV
jgi:hypothetical protein